MQEFNKRASKCGDDSAFNVHQPYITQSDSDSDFSSNDFLDNLQHQDESQSKENFFTGSRNRKAHCASKNAVLARENRLKKKMLMQKMDSDNKILKYENIQLKSKLNKKTKQVQILRREMDYLKGIIRNQSNISVLLSGLNAALRKKGNMNFSSDTELAPTSPLLKSSSNGLDLLKDVGTASSLLNDPLLSCLTTDLDSEDCLQTSPAEQPPELSQDSILPQSSEEHLRRRGENLRDGNKEPVSKEMV